MEKEAMIEIIERHNKVVDTLMKCEIKISDTQVLMAMSIWHTLACEGLSIVTAARSIGIDCKADMQAGRILLYNDDMACEARCKREDNLYV